jgi:hypothetical protein
MRTALPASGSATSLTIQVSLDAADLPTRLALLRVSISSGVQVEESGSEFDAVSRN